MTSTSCPLCLRDLGARPFVMAELQLCQSCGQGNLARNLYHVGIELSASQSTLQVNNHTHQVLEVEARMSALRGQKADFSKLDLVGKAINFLSPRAVTGDDIFDDHVRATSKNAAWLGMLLESDAIRTACIEIVTKEHSSFKIRGPEVHLYAQGQHIDSTDLVEMARGAALVLRKMAVLEECWGTGAR